LKGTLIYYASPQLSLRAIVGTEEDNYTTGGKEQSGTIKGAGFNWRPTPRTSLDGTYENHVYGNTYDLRLAHRRPLATFDLSLTRGITSSYQTATTSLGSYYYNLVSSSLISQFPDAAQRDQATRQALKQLGVSNSTAFGNFVTNSFFFDQRLQAGVSLIGARHTLAFSFYRSDQEQTNQNQELSFDDSFASNNNVKSWGATASFVHQLTPISNLNATIFWTRSDGSGGGPSQTSRDKALLVGYGRQLGKRTFASVNYRHEVSSGDDPFTENSVTASLSLPF
jgi:uncharacterized protein (PEP-CTERM system associated)